MVLENVTLISPVIDYMSGIWQTAKVLLGGLFGIYIIAIILRFLEYKKISKTLVAIKRDIDKLREQLIEAKVVRKKKK